MPTTPAPAAAPVAAILGAGAAGPGDGGGGPVTIGGGAAGRALGGAGGATAAIGGGACFSWSALVAGAVSSLNLAAGTLALAWALEAWQVDSRIRFAALFLYFNAAISLLAIAGAQARREPAN